MDGVNKNITVYLGRREGTNYLFKIIKTGDVLEIQDSYLFGKSILKVGRECVLKHMRPNCYIVS